MNTRRLNWPLWVGLLLTFGAFLSYFFVFVQFPVTGDFPWANLLLFALEAVFLIFGFRRGFSDEKAHLKGYKIVTLLVGIPGVAIFGGFVLPVFCGGLRF